MSGLSRTTLSAVVTIALATVLGCSEPGNADLLSSAKSYLEKKNATAAIVQLKALLQKEPNSPEVRYLMGQALLEQSNPTAALLELKKASTLGFNTNLVSPLLAKALLATAQYKVVVEEFAGKTLTDPTAQGEIHTSLAIAQAALGNSREMAAALESALKVAPNLAWALRTKARVLTARSNFQDALLLVDQAIKSDPTNGDGHQLRGAILFGSKKDDVGALASFQKSLQDPKTALAAHMSIIAMHLSTDKRALATEQFAQLKKAFPKSMHTVYAEAQLAYQDKNYVRTKEVLQPLMNVFPNSAQLLLFAGSADKQRGALLSAEAQLAKAVQLAPELADARKALAETLLQMGHPNKAHTVLRPLLEGSEVDAAAVALSASAYLQEGKLQQAVAQYQLAEKLAPDDVQIRTALALAELAKGQAGAAFGKLQSIAASDAGSTADMALIAAHMRRKEHAAALSAIDKLQAKQPKLPTASYLRGLVQRQRLDLKAARAAFEDALRLEPTHYVSTANLASIDMAELMPSKAQARFEAVIKQNPQNASAYMALADVLVQQRAKPEVIVALLQSAIAANPTEVGPRLGLLAILIDTKDSNQALSAAQAALAAIPNQPDVLYAAGRALANAGDDQQAISTFSKLINLQPKAPLPHLRLADIFARRKDEAAAALSTRRAFDVAPESADVQRSVIQLMQRTRDSTLAFSLARDLQKRQPQRASGFLFEGDLHSLSKSWPKAEAAYRLALNKTDPSGRSAISVYTTLVAAGQAGEAEKFASGWIKEHPKDLLFQSRRAEAAMAKNDFGLAESRFLEVLTIEPNDLSALNNVAWLLAKRGKKESLAYAQRALAIAPDDASVQDTLAYAFAASGQTTEAIAAQLRALVLKPNEPVFRLSLAKLYISAGEKDKARVELDSLTTLGAKFAGQAEVASLKKSLQ